MKLALIGVIIALASAACSRGLSHDEATAVITRNQLIRASDNVSVDAVASTNDSESIVRASVRGRTMNLKFRRFDSGWTWEFVETKAGGWITPDVAIAQIREEERASAATKWANEHQLDYRSTASTLNILMIYIPNPEMGRNVQVWMQWRHRFAEVFKNDRRPEMQERRAVLANDHAADAWGNELLVNFDASSNQVLLLSVGPDKLKNTWDDIACISKARQVFEDGALRWTHDKSWKVPEGLGNTVESFTDKPLGTIEYARVMIGVE
jgi:hypothetical protein